MKAAVLIGGQYREFDTAIKMCKYGEIFDCDYYITTWSYSKQEYEDRSGIFKEFEVHGSMITDYLPNAKYQILEEKKYFPNPILITHNKLFYLWQNCFKMLEGKHYDIIILSRMDNVVTLKQPVHYLNVYKETEIYGDLIQISGVNPFEFCTQDKFFLGRFNIMKRFIEGLPDMTDPNVVFDCHMDLAKYIIYTIGTHIDDEHPFSHCYIRPNHTD